MVLPRTCMPLLRGLISAVNIDWESAVRTIVFLMTISYPRLALHRYRVLVPSSEPVSLRGGCSGNENTPPPIPRLHYCRSVISNRPSAIAAAAAAGAIRSIRPTTPVSTPAMFALHKAAHRAAVPVAGAAVWFSGIVPQRALGEAHRSN